MSESYREQHPLLYEDLSEEEQFSPRYQRRFRPMVCKGRAKTSVKGAAAIIRLWPEHWSSSVTYWWIALGMIGLLTIIVYNSVVVFTMLPPGNFKHPKPYTDNPLNPVLEDVQPTPNIYMHIFVENNQEIDLNNYMPYIDIIANKYNEFKYHLILVFNDTASETNDLSAEENNELALNLLWAKNSVHESHKNNVVIEQVTLSKYMNNSPLRQTWRKLPKQFLQFLTRAVSIWDKGGIAFNPSILTPRSPHAVYIEKIQNILKNYRLSSNKNTIERNHIKKSGNVKKKVNNIRDIIDALEQEDEFSIPPESSTYEEANHKIREKNIIRPTLQNTLNKSTNQSSDYQHLHPKFNRLTKDKPTVDDKSSGSKETLDMAESKVNNKSINLLDNNGTSPVGILPMFLEFLFKNKHSYFDSQNNTHDELTTLTRKRKYVSTSKSNIEQYSDHPGKKINEKLKPLIITPKTYDSDKSNDVINTVTKDILEEAKPFTIDLKGNIVSSGFPCHAFLGTMFSNANHHIQESLTDFIITELSIFCKGALSSCKGIDVILL